MHLEVGFPHNHSEIVQVRIGYLKIRNTAKNSSICSYFDKILILARHGPIGSRPNAQNTNSQVVSSAASEPQPVTSSTSTAPDSVSLEINIFSKNRQESELTYSHFYNSSFKLP